MAEESTPQSSKSQGSEAKLFVGNLHTKTSNESLREYFGTFGCVKNVSILKDHITQRSKEFITFAENSSAENVLNRPVHTVDGTRVYPKRALSKRSLARVRLFVGGLSRDTLIEDIKFYFSVFGKVENVIDCRRQNHRGFAFVLFEHEGSLDHAYKFTYHTIKNKAVERKRCIPKKRFQQANAPLLGQHFIPNDVPMLETLTAQQFAAASQWAPIEVIAGRPIASQLQIPAQY